MYCTERTQQFRNREARDSDQYDGAQESIAETLRTGL